MLFKGETLAGAAEGYWRLTDYHKDVRALFEITDTRFRLQEYGVRLASLSSGKLITNATDYLLADDSAYPYFLWLPSWIGRFYVDANRIPEGSSADEYPAEQAGFIAFIWTWLGFGDAYVKDVTVPECWIGVVDHDGADPGERAIDVADMIWKYFRVERGFEAESDGWLTGFLRRNEIGCRLDGRWHLRRFPLIELSSFYNVERLIIRPLGEKFHELARVRNG